MSLIQSTSSPSDRNLLTSDITTNNASSTKHGFLPKLDNTATHFLDMTGTQRVLAIADLPVGTCIQQVSTETGAVATTTTLIPLDDTVPQNTEGAEFMTCAITPKATINILIIEVLFWGSINAVADMIIALFQDTTANALAAASFSVSSTNLRGQVALRHVMTAGTTSATTFKVRAGPHAASTLTFNGIAATREFGGVANSSIVIREHKA